MSGETLAYRGQLVGHNDWVTSLATTPEDPNLLLSSSRDKSVMVWHLTHSSSDPHYGYAKRSLKGHNHFVSDVVMSSDGAFCLSASWDNELRLWDIATGQTTRRFVGHTKDVLSVAFSADNRQIVSGTCLLWLFFAVDRDVLLDRPEATILFFFSLSFTNCPLHQVLVTPRSVSGTPSVNASTPYPVPPIRALPLPPKAIPNGSLVFASLPVSKSPSLFRLVGIASSKSGTCPTASSATT